MCQSRPSADGDAVRAVRVQRVVVAQHGQQSGGQQTHGHGQRQAVQVHGEPQEGGERRTIERCVARATASTAHLPQPRTEAWHCLVSAGKASGRTRPLGTSGNSSAQRPGYGAAAARRRHRRACMECGELPIRSTGTDRILPARYECSTVLY